MPDVAAELEAALTSAGTLLVWLEKYRLPDPGTLPALRRRVLEVGDRARHAARSGRLEGAAAHELLAAVTEANRELRRQIDAVRAGTLYRRATAAHAAGNHGVLTTLLPGIFTGLRVDAAPAAAFWTPVWQRRGHPLPAEQIALAVAGVALDGVPATADDLLPGVDPELPGVVLSCTAPSGVPLALRWDHDALPAACLHLDDDQLVFPGVRLRLPFVVVLASPDEPLDEWVADPGAYLDGLETACRARALAVERMPTPAASS